MKGYIMDYVTTATLTPSHLIGRKTIEGQAYHFTNAGYVSRPIVDNVGSKTMRLPRPDFLTPRA